MNSDQHTLPRDLTAERQALELARAIWGALDPDDEFEREAHVFYRYERGTDVRAEARSPLGHGSQFEVAVRGKNSGEAARMLVTLLVAYRNARVEHALQPDERSAAAYGTLAGAHVVGTPSRPRSRPQPTGYTAMTDLDLYGRMTERRR